MESRYKSKPERTFRNFENKMKNHILFRVKINNDHLLNFSRWYLATRGKHARLVRYIQCMKVIERIIPKDFDKYTKDDIIKVLNELEEMYSSEHTKQVFRVAIKLFFKWLKGYGDKKSYPELVDFISTNIRKKEFNKEILTEEEIERMAKACTNVRDRAIIWVLYESGARAGEFLGLKVGDVSFDEYGAVIIVNGKTGTRRIRLVISAKHLAEYLNVHPFKDNPNAPLWVNLSTNRYGKLLDYPGLRKLVKTIAKRAGIKKKVHPHIFRHSRATHLANKLTESQLKELFGWTQSSKMASVYVHLSGRDVDNALLEIYGLKVERKKNGVLKPVKCPKCGEMNSPEADYCEKCGFPLRPELLREELEKRKIADDIVYQIVKELINRYPDIKRKIVEIIQELGLVEKISKFTR